MLNMSAARETSNSSPTPTFDKTLLLWPRGPESVVKPQIAHFIDVEKYFAPDSRLSALLSLVMMEWDPRTDALGISAQWTERRL